MLRPLISIVVFDEGDLTPLANSIKALDDKYRACLDIDFVIFDKKCNDKNKNTLMSLRTKSSAQFVDYVDRFPKDQFEKYGIGKTIITKKVSDTITEDEIKKLLNWKD